MPFGFGPQPDSQDLSLPFYLLQEIYAHARARAHTHTQTIHKLSFNLFIILEKHLQKRNAKYEMETHNIPLLRNTNCAAIL